MNEEERLIWQQKYDPRVLELGMVPRDIFVDFNNVEYFKQIQARVEQFEAHIGETLPDDFRKYLLYCGHLFFNWSCCGIKLNGWNEEDQTDNEPYCLWCKQPLANTKCTCDKVFDGYHTPANDEDDEDGDYNEEGLIRFSHEGCGFFKFIVVKGPLKGSIWSTNNCGPYLTKDRKTFKELLDQIYSSK
jgi:hypothetical protein